MIARLELLLVGFGHVGQRFVELLVEHETTLARDYGIRTSVVGIATRRHGRVHDPRGLDPAGWESALRRTGAADRPTDTAGFIAQVAAGSTATHDGRFVVVETTTLDIEDGEPAVGHVLAGLNSGAHVITTNKGPAAFAYGTLSRAAALAGRRFLFEGAVMDGVPIFNLCRETLPAVTVRGFRGVVNSTTNHIITAMERGQSFDAALKAMQHAGIAEADPSLDVDGWDAAAKTAVLANVLLGASRTPQTVTREGISAAAGARAVAARAKGRRLKLVASASRTGSGADARVALEELPESDVLGSLDGQQNAIVLDTDLLGEIAIVQRGAGLTETAYALLSDLLTIARTVSGARGG